MKFTIICATNKNDVLCDNLLRSKGIFEHQIILKKGYTNICKAYNEGMQQAECDYVIFVHQDVSLSDNFFKDLEAQIDTLFYKEWGVLGVAGRNIGGAYIGNLLDRGKEWIGTQHRLPAEVMTLDELLLVTRRNAFTFDENLTSNHLFGTDICMQSISQGYKNFAIDSYCEHNCYDLENVTSDKLPKEFQDAKEYIKNKWINYLPIYTTCTTIE